MKKVFISHPYSNDPISNLLKANKICKSITNEDYDILPLSPLHLFSFYDNDLARKEIIEVCYRLIDMSDEVWIYGNSEGCQLEMEYATQKNKTIRRKQQWKIQE